jgi:hypothetical protein
MHTLSVLGALILSVSISVAASDQKKTVTFEYKESKTSHSNLNSKPPLATAEYQTALASVKTLPLTSQCAFLADLTDNICKQKVKNPQGHHSYNQLQKDHLTLLLPAHHTLNNVIDVYNKHQFEQPTQAQQIHHKKKRNILKHNNQGTSPAFKYWKWQEEQAQLQAQSQVSSKVTHKTSPTHQKSTQFSAQKNNDSNSVIKKGYANYDALNKHTELLPNGYLGYPLTT